MRPILTTQQILDQGVNFLLVGVGGQGTIMASNILAEVGLDLGLDVKKAEIHGMSQRGGSVVSQLRWGRLVYSPIVPEGQTDFLLAFEKLEAGRYAAYLRSEGIVLVSNQKLLPLSVSAGGSVYPSDAELEGTLRRKTSQVHWVDAMQLAEELGNVKTANSVLIGALSAFIAADAEVWRSAIEKRVPGKFAEINLRAFEIGRSLFA